MATLNKLDLIDRIMLNLQIDARYKNIPFAPYSIRVRLQMFTKAELERHLAAPRGHEDRLLEVA